ncbi:hypothetical protein BDR26DRAFT_918396 [Obelidium mucronatum]|nr:hypothetical protein BDR26DRAFT_918396 [Obelidium mucronatum]
MSCKNTQTYPHFLLTLEMAAVFRFYSGSKAVLPGLGAGESLDALESSTELLATETNWRKAFGNDFVHSADGSSIASFLETNGNSRKKQKLDGNSRAIDEPEELLHQALAQKFLGSETESLPYKLIQSKDMRVLAAILAMQKSKLGQTLLDLKPRDSFSKFYFPLAKEYPDFRRVLSNFYLFDMVDPETGLTWPSMEHFFHAHKIQLVSNNAMKDIHDQLVVLVPAKVKSATSKRHLTMTQAQLDKWDREVKGGVMQRGLRLKFLGKGKDSLPFKVLVATCDATLQHVSRGVAGDAFSLGRQLMAWINILLKNKAMTSSDWTIESWRADEQNTRARQAPAGLTTAMHSSLLLPSLALHRPPFTLLEVDDRVLESNEDEAAIWSQMKALLKQTNPINCDAFINATSSFSNANANAQYTEPMSYLAQKSLDFCSRGLELPTDKASNQLGPTNASTFLANLNQSLLMPLEEQMEVQMRYLETNTDDLESPLTRSRSLDSFEKTPSTVNGPVTPISRKPKSRVVPPPQPPPSSKRRNSNSIISTPAVENEEQESVAINSDGAWKNVLSKCVDSITSLLKADDLIHAGELDSSPLIDAQSGFPTLAAMESIHRSFRRLLDMGKGQQLVEALEEEEGDQWTKRILRVCEKVLVGCECIITFGKPSASGKVAEEDTNNAEDSRDQDENPEIGFERTFEASILGLEAACLVLVVINGSIGSKRGYGEETIASLIAMVKSRFSELFAVVKLYSDESDEANKNSSLRDLLDSSNAKKKCVQIANKLCYVLRLLVSMFSRQSLNDSLIIATYVMCIPAFFIESNSISVFIGMEKVQLNCIDVVRSVFAQATSHRIPILEEIAGYLVKLQTVKRGMRLYKLRNGKAIQMVSALVLTLVQSTFHGVEVVDTVKEVRDVVLQVSQGLDSMTEGAAGRNQERLVVEKILSTAKHGLDSAQSCGIFFLKYLLSRSFADNAGKEKSGTPGRRSLVSSTESELRVIFENLIDDFLLVLGEPEWPGADFLLLLLCKIMTQTLDDKRAGETALKSLALDFLGQLTSRLYASANIKSLGLKLEGVADTTIIEQFSNQIQGSLTTESNELSISKLLGLWEVQSILIDFLKLGRDNDLGYDSARSFHVFCWLHSLSSALSNISNMTDPLLSTVRNILLQYCESLDTKLSANTSKSIWLTAPVLPANLSSETMLKIGTWCNFRRSPLQSIRETLLQYILACLDSDTVTLRTRSLKALSDVVSVDATVLSLASVKTVISNRLLDPSKMVRDAAVELVASYLMKDYNEVLIAEYYPLLIPRMLDVGAAVRKRVIKLMKDLLGSIILKEANDGVTIPLSMMDRSVEIVCKIMARVSDEETSIQDLSLKALSEIWFAPFKMGTPQISGLIQKSDETVDMIIAHLCKRSGAYVDQSVQCKFEIKCRIALLLRVADSVTGVNNADAIGDIMKQLLDTSLIKKRDVVIVARTLVECLTDGILGAEESGDKDLVRTSLILLSQISRVLPQLLLPHIKMFHTYLKSGVLPTLRGEEERLAKLREEKITAAVVSILGGVIPCSNEPDLNLMAAIEGDLLALLSRGSLPAVNLIVPCLTNTVHHVTKNYYKLTKVLKTCLDNFQKSRAMIDSSPGYKGGLNPANARAIARGLIIVSLLVRHFNFDKNRGLLKDQAATDIANFPNVLNSVYEYVDLFAERASSPELKAIALQAFGNLFMAHPGLMITNRSQGLMNKVFKTGLISHRIELIKIFVNFLKNEQIRMMNEEMAKKLQSVKAKSVDIKVLIGDADEMADAGVSGSLIQMYVGYILDGLMDTDATLSTIAFDAVCIITDQGLVHPLLCVPYVVAMHTSVIPSVRDRAIALYDNMAEKHQSFIHSKTGECVKRAFEYRMNLERSAVETNGLVENPVWASAYIMESHLNEDGSVAGQSPLALLSYMYAKIQVKRPRRNEFLATLVRSFDMDAAVAQDEAIPYGRFIADTLATLNYKSLDEVLGIIHHICQVLSVSGETILKAIEELKAEAQTDENLLNLTAKSSVLIGMLVNLKSFLQKLYDLSESKCRRFTPSESSRNTEKSRPAIRQPSASSVIDWARWPYANQKMLSSKKNMMEQLELFVELMNTDYYVGVGPDDDDDMFGEGADSSKDADESNDGETVASPVKPKGKKRSSMATAASSSTIPAKKARRSSIKGNNGANRSNAVTPFESPAPDRPKRSQSRAALVEQSDESDDE